jgi:peptidoglycan/xylan/chitin deacetylase (PgdA/CDA1 family)
MSGAYLLESFNIAARRAYVAEQVSTIVGHPVMPPDTLTELAWALLTRREEYDAPRDRHGNVPTEQSVLAKLGLLEHPPLDADVQALAGAAPIACWPKPFRFAACLTHDIDDVVAHPWRERLRRLREPGLRAAPIERLRWALGALRYRLAGDRGERSPFDAWMAEEARHGFHSTFFVMPETYVEPTPFDHYHRYDDPVWSFGARMTYAEAIRQTDAAGWEIGLHGGYASALDGAMLSAERARLETVLGAPVRAGRQHYLRFDIDATPAAWAQAALLADSTMGSTTHIGYRAGLSFPYFWPGEADILEVPLALHDICLPRAPGDPVARARALLARAAEIGGVVTLSWHTHSAAPEALTTYRALLAAIVELGGWGCTIGELNTWWRARRTAMRARMNDTREELDNAA